MPNLEICLSSLVDGSKLPALYEIFGRKFDNEAVAAAWEQAVNARRYAFLAAKLGNTTTVGIVSIKWDGVDSRYTYLYPHVMTAFPDEQLPSPMIQGLEVLDAHRGRGIGHVLMDAAESSIAHNPKVANRVVLTVRTDNEPAINLYKSRGYNKILADGEGTVLVESTDKQADGTMVPVEVESVAMYKNL